MVGGLVSLVWCLIVLVFSLSRVTPGTSLFPEIDFASKVSRDANSPPHSLEDILASLSVANTCEIRKALAHSKFHVQMNPASLELGQGRPVAVMECEVVNEARMLDSVGEVETYESVILNGKF
jgi:hypothetical protein